MSKHTLYDDLMTLCENSDSFYYVDRQVLGETYRVFNYRLTSWTEMLRPNARNCRGTTFLATRDGGYILASLPPEKFFNYEEGTIDHTQHQIGCVMNKLDGSLISTVDIGKNYCLLKSKSSFDSEQAIAATDWLDANANHNFLVLIYTISSMGFTVNMEWTSPENRIVVPYQESRLTILNIRDNTIDGAFGTTYYGNELVMKLASYDLYGEPEFFVDYQVMRTSDHNVINKMKEEEVGEGYVVEIQHPEGSYLVKVKNHKYLSLHKTKDIVNIPFRLFEAVIMEFSDDLRGLFADDAYSMNKINAMEELVVSKFNSVIRTVESFYEQNGKEDRKTYAIKAQQELPTLMSLCMNRYLKKENNYKAFALKHPELFGFNNVTESVAELVDE